MVTFLPQARPEVPRNAFIDQSPIRQGVNAIRQGIEQRRTNQDLAAVNQLARSGGSIEAITNQLMASRNPNLAAQGLNQLFRSDAQAKQNEFLRQKAEANRNTFETVDIPGTGPVQRNTRTGEIKALPLSFDRRQELRRAGSTNVNVNTGAGQPNLESLGDETFAKETAKKDAGRFDRIIEGGRKARQRAGDLNLLEASVKAAKTNRLADIRTAFQGFADAFGIDTSQFGSLSDAELIQSVAQRVAPSLRQPGSGAQSDTELKGFLASIPGLTKSIPGNKAIISVLRQMNVRAQEEEAIALQANAGTISRSEANKRMSKLGPVISRKMAKSIRFLATKSASLGDGNFAFTPETGDLWQKGKDGKWRKFEPK